MHAKISDSHTPFTYKFVRDTDRHKKISEKLRIKIKKSNIRDDKKLRNDLKFFKQGKFNYLD